MEHTRCFYVPELPYNLLSIIEYKTARFDKYISEIINEDVVGSAMK